MKSRLPLLAAALVFTALPLTAVAQDSFPDTPANHWAYDALRELKAAGLLVGYPDGLYRGTRPASRYEMAVAMHAVYANLKGILDALQSQYEKTRGIDPQDIQDLKDRLGSINDQILVLRKLGPAIADLKRAADTFELELEQLGVNVEAMKKDLGQLSDRISKLEKKKATVDIRGDSNFWLGEGNSREDSYGLNKDGRILGFGGTGPVTGLFPPVSSAVGLEHDRTILNESAFTFAGTNEVGPKWQGTIVISNMFGNSRTAVPGVGFGNQSDVFNPTSVGAPVAGLIGYQTGSEDIYVQDASISIGNPKAEIQMGRLGYSLSPYMYQRIDNTTYFANDRWDNGKYYFDGVLGNARLGPANLTLFGGKNSGLLSVNGVELNPVRSGPLGGFLNADPTMAAGSLTFDRSLGANLKVSLGKRAHLDFGYLLLEADMPTAINVSTNANHLTVYGVDGETQLGSFNLHAGYHKSDTQLNSTTVEGKDDSASDVRIGFAHRGVDFFAEYRQVEANYVAPGDWGRIGVLRDPNNIKGVRLGTNFKFLRHFSVDAHGDFEAGLSNNYSTSTYLGAATAIRGYDVRLNYDLNKTFALFAEYESTTLLNLAAPQSYVGSGNPSYRWATFGLGYHFAANTIFNLQYELDDINNDYQTSGGANFHGGFLTSQLTFKF